MDLKTVSIKFGMIKKYLSILEVDTLLQHRWSQKSLTAQCAAVHALNRTGFIVCTGKRQQFIFYTLRDTTVHITIQNIFFIIILFYNNKIEPFFIYHIRNLQKCWFRNRECVI